MAVTMQETGQTVQTEIDQTAGEEGEGLLMRGQHDMLLYSCIGKFGTVSVIIEAPTVQTPCGLARLSDPKK